MPAEGTLSDPHSSPGIYSHFTDEKAKIQRGKPLLTSEFNK